MSRPLSNRERTIFLLTVAIVGLYLADQFVVSPLWRDYAALSASLSSSEELLFKERLLVKNNSHLLRQADKNKPSIPTDLTPQDTTALIKELTLICQRHGIKIKDIQPLPLKKTSNAQVWALRFSMESYFSQMAGFLNDLSSSPVGFQVERMELSRFVDKSSMIKGQLTVEKNFY